jgi:peptidoglycan/LPS O-acetylase OafA/YrhL
MSPAHAGAGLAPTRLDSDNPGGFAHVPALDGVRGLAILLVLFDHLFWSNSAAAHGLLAVIAGVRDSAYAGVNLFFALSGFLITGILLDTLDVPHYFRNFYARRSLRIFPLYYGALFALMLLSRPMHFTWSGWQYYDLTYTANLAVWRHNAPLNLGPFVINHFWSLQVEEQFYLFWPLIVFRIRSPEKLVRVSLVGCALILSLRVIFVMMAGKPGFTNQYLTYSPTFSCADNILFGCCLAALLRSGWRDTVKKWAPRVLAAVTIVLVAYGWRNRGLEWFAKVGEAQDIFMPTIGATLLGIASTAVIAMTLQQKSKTERIFRNPVLRFFGAYSYGIYVFHYTLHNVLTGPIRAFLNGRLHSKALAVLGAAVVVGLASVLIAFASYHLYEKHFLRLKKFFGYQWGGVVSKSPEYRLEHEQVTMDGS